jgi:hypothetical protein
MTSSLKRSNQCSDLCMYVHMFRISEHNFVSRMTNSLPNFICLGRISDPLCLSSSLALHFYHHSFLAHHPVNQDDRHLLALAKASDFSVAWQFSQREQLVFLFGSNSIANSLAKIFQKLQHWSPQVGVSVQQGGVPLPRRRHPVRPGTDFTKLCFGRNLFL